MPCEVSHAVVKLELITKPTAFAFFVSTGHASKKASKALISIIVKMVKVSRFGELDEKVVYQYTLENGNMTVEVMDLSLVA